MSRPQQHLNIPIEIVRTVVAISETGSLTKAGERLGLSQPAVSSQIKRIQNLLGGSLFVRTPNGTITTELGKLVLNQARRMLEANDQMLRLGGAAEAPRPVRLGISTLLVREFISRQSADVLAGVFIQTDNSVAISRGLIDGYLDIACIFEHAVFSEDVSHLVVDETSQRMVWVRSRNFVLSPGAPIPILTWPSEEWMIPTLTRRGLAYRIVFNSPDFHAKLYAAEAGVGLTAVPENMVPPSLVVAKEYYLPELPPIRALLCARLGLSSDTSMMLLKQLSGLFRREQDSPTDSTRGD